MRVLTRLALVGVHNMHMNGQPKSGTKCCRHAASFSSLFVLRVQYIFNMETELVMRCLKPRWFSSINTYDRHANQNQSRTTHNASRFLPLLSAVTQRPLHLDGWRAPGTGRAGLQNHCAQWSCTGIGQRRFLERVLRDYEMSSSSHDSSTSLLGMHYEMSSAACHRPD
jgi:hypothetical protein